MAKYLSLNMYIKKWEYLHNFGTHILLGLQYLKYQYNGSENSCTDYLWAIQGLKGLYLKLL